MECGATEGRCLRTSAANERIACGVWRAPSRLPLLPIATSGVASGSICATLCPFSPSLAVVTANCETSGRETHWQNQIISSRSARENLRRSARRTRSAKSLSPARMQGPTTRMLQSSQRRRKAMHRGRQPAVEQSGDRGLRPAVASRHGLRTARVWCGGAELGPCAFVAAAAGLALAGRWADDRDDSEDRELRTCF
jgi:hypothetical protein